MDRLTINELVAMAGALLFGAGLWADWYEAVSPLAVLAGTTGLGMLAGSALRTGETSRRRKPPGTI